MNVTAASAGRAWAAEKSAQKSASDAQNLATAFRGISSMAENINAWLTKETAAAGGQGMCVCIELFYRLFVNLFAFIEIVRCSFFLKQQAKVRRKILIDAHSYNLLTY